MVVEYGEHGEGGRDIERARAKKRDREKLETTNKEFLKWHRAELARQRNRTAQIVCRIF